MTTITCTAVFHQGEERHEWVGVGRNHVDAFVSAATNQSVPGLLPGPENRESAQRLLSQWSLRPEYAASVRDGHAYLNVGLTGPEISIGWVTYTFTQSVRLWAVQAQVEVHLEREGWSMSRQVPTFYLDPSVQGITGPESARAVAEDIFRTLSGDDEDVRLHVTVDPVY
ncbi:MAG: hypothetical protein E6R04_08285 [Spirochaetes bacterium]|nr:MAG: hypothetical protein E6R04_08285 [Spirochaetota bacterium]